MDHRFLRSRGACAAARMPVRRVLFFLALASGLAVAACGGGSSDGDSAATTLGDAESITIATTVSTTGGTRDRSPDELGESVVATWAEAMQKLIELLNTKPEPEAVRGEVEQLKEEYVAKLVEFGRQREALDAGIKAQVSVRTAAGLEAAGGEDWYSSYLSLYEGYQAGDQEFANLLASFNILTQYADFDLLTQQSPEEAARLGIE